MAKPWEIPKPANLPDPELNPLMNPTLGKNLGRWAQVYFTSPPESREKAVGQLLRDLQGGTAEVQLPNANSQNVEPEVHREQPHGQVICPRCHEPNSTSHRFCGICGTQLANVREGVQREVAAPVAPTPHVYAEHFVASEQPSDDIQWLRDRSLAGEAESEGSNRKTWIFALLALAVVLAGAAYLQWAPGNRAASSPSAATPAADQPASPDQPLPEEGANSTASPSAVTSNSSAVATKPAGPKRAAKSEPTPAKAENQGTVASRDADIQSVAENGSTEFAEAQRLLNGNPAQRNPQIAARLLWKSVGKENAGAEVVLADLYTRGEGVGKNCDQARLLLTAALKKGADGAAQKLRSLESGCQ